MPIERCSTGASPDEAQPTAVKASLTTVTAIEGELGFKRVGSWSLQECRTKLDCSPPGRDANRKPSVYMIVSVSDVGAAVLYVGKGSDGWRKRRTRHLGNRHRTFHEVIIRELLAGHAVDVFERPAGWAWTGSFRGSTHDAEEMALFARFHPCINDPADVRRAIRLQE